MPNSLGPSSSDSVHSATADPPGLPTRKWLAKNYPFFLMALLFFTLGSFGSARFQSYTWVMTVHMRDMPDGSVVAISPGDPTSGDLAAILQITLTAQSEGEWMTVGRAYAAKEEVIQLSPKRAALYTPTLRPEIAAALQNPIQPPQGEDGLTRQSQAAFLEAISVYLSGSGTKSVLQIPAWGEWSRLLGVLMGVCFMGLAVWNRLRSVLYCSQGRERLALDQCPHCGHPLTLTDEVICAACGTDHVEWAAVYSICAADAVVNAEVGIRTPPVPPTAI